MNRRPAAGVTFESHVVPLFPVRPQPRDRWPTHDLGRELADLAERRNGAGGGGVGERKAPVAAGAACRSLLWAPLAFMGGWTLGASLFAGVVWWLLDRRHR
ncbi:hypothetical protein BH24ACT15_BH24ACT15_31780 [soil metagenome]